MSEKIFRTLSIGILFTLAVIPLFALPVKRMEKRLRFPEPEGELILPVREGETVESALTLPQELLVDAPAVLVRSGDAALSVYLDGALLFSHDEETKSAEGCSGNHYIPLPADCRGKTLRLCFVPLRDNAFRGLHPVVFGSLPDLYLYQSLRGLMGFLTASFLSIYAIVFIVAALFFIRRTPLIRTQIYAAMLFLILSVWLFSHLGFFEMLTASGHTIRLENALIYCAIPVFFAFLRLQPLPAKRILFRVFAVLGCLIGLVCALLSFFFPRFSDHLRFGFPVLCAVALLFLLHYFLHAARTRSFDPSSMIQLIGVFVLLLCCFAHMVCAALFDAYGIPRGVFGRNIMPFGALFLLETQLIYYFSFASRIMARQAERPPLDQMAYRDFLTKLPNRTDADQVLVRVAKSQSDFCLVMFDVNGLKTVNDRLGHDAGDRLLVNFARVLRASFGEGAYLARLGGDEFIAVLEEESAPYVERHLSMLEEGLKKLDLAEPEIAHSAAFGFAFRHECAEEHILLPEEEELSTYPVKERRKKGKEGRAEVREENVESSESRYAQGTDILSRVMALADLRMYERKRTSKHARERTKRAKT